MTMMQKSAKFEGETRRMANILPICARWSSEKTLQTLERLVA